MQVTNSDDRLSTLLRMAHDQPQLERSPLRALQRLWPDERRSIWQTANQRRKPAGDSVMVVQGRSPQQVRLMERKERADTVAQIAPSTQLCI